MTGQRRRDPFPWIAFPVIVWAAFGANSLIVYFAQAGGPVPLWLGVWGIACTLGCGALVANGIRIIRRERHGR